MIRKLLFSLTLAGASTFGFSQICTPDMSVPDYGIYPDSATGFDTAWVGQPYNMTVTNYVPPDTCVVILFPPCSVLSMDSIVITGFTGLPPNFTYGCEPPGCAFLGGQYGCVLIYSTVDPTVADTGRYNLVIDVEAYVGGTGLPNPFTIDYYYIDVLEMPSGIDDGYQSISGISSRPNPFNDETTISFDLEVPARVDFEVINMLGEIVHRERITGQSGNNTIRFDRGDLPEGIYIYSISSGESIQTRKLIING